MTEARHDLQKFRTPTHVIIILQFSAVHVKFSAKKKPFSKRTIIISDLSDLDLNFARCRQLFKSVVWQYYLVR